MLKVIGYVAIGALISTAVIALCTPNTEVSNRTIAESSEPGLAACMTSAVSGNGA